MVFVRKAGEFVKRTKPITFTVADRPGLACEVIEALWSRNVAIRAFRMNFRRGRVEFKLKIDKLEAARRVFAENGWIANKDSKRGKID